MAQSSTFPRSHVLILGPNSVQSLLPVTPISQAEALLDDHRIEDVIQLADQQRKKVQSKLVVDASEVSLFFLPCCCLSENFCRWKNWPTSTSESASDACLRHAS